jgi:hypothetical protein
MAYLNSLTGGVSPEMPVGGREIPERPPHWLERTDEGEAIKRLLGMPELAAQGQPLEPTIEDGRPVFQLPPVYPQEREPIQVNPIQHRFSPGNAGQDMLASALRRAGDEVNPAVLAGFKGLTPEKIAKIRGEAGGFLKDVAGGRNAYRGREGEIPLTTGADPNLIARIYGATSGGGAEAGPAQAGSALNLADETPRGQFAATELDIPGNLEGPAQSATGRLLGMMRVGGGRFMGPGAERLMGLAQEETKRAKAQQEFATEMLKTDAYRERTAAQERSDKLRGGGAGEAPYTRPGYDEYEALANGLIERVFEGDEAGAEEARRMLEELMAVNPQAIPGFLMQLKLAGGVDTESQDPLDAEFEAQLK